MCLAAPTEATEASVSAAVPTQLEPSEATDKPSILNQIFEQRAKDVEAAKASPGSTPDDIRNLLEMCIAPPLISFVDRLKRNPSSSSQTPPRPSLMAEIKRASPSKGDINPTVNVPSQTFLYTIASASVISVLTEPKWFKGSLLDLRAAREAVAEFSDRPAILRKDFILDEYQIDEARLYGADSILLIVAMLSPERFKALYDHSLSRGMEPLVEVNNAEEMQRALELGAKVIGVNNRNLHDFQVDMGTTTRLADMVKDRDIVLCALSGIDSPSDVDTFAEQGVKAVLVGEALMRTEEQQLGSFCRELLGWPAPPPPSGPREPRVKVTGIIDMMEAFMLKVAGVDMLGLVFDPNYSRCIPVDDAMMLAGVMRFSSEVKPGALSQSPLALMLGGSQSKAQSMASDEPKLDALTTSTTTPSNLDWFMQSDDLVTKTTRRPQLVGIFNNQPLEYILHVVREVGLDFVQLNGNEPANWAHIIPVPVIRRFSADEPATAPVPWGMADLFRPGYHSLATITRLKGDPSKEVMMNFFESLDRGHLLANMPVLVDPFVFPKILAGLGFDIDLDNLPEGVNLDGVINAVAILKQGPDEEAGEEEYQGKGKGKAKAQESPVRDDNRSQVDQGGAASVAASAGGSGKGAVSSGAPPMEGENI